MSIRRALAILLAAATSGCVTELDMAHAHDSDRAATTIPYAGVRGARTFADYESISRSILTGADPMATAKPGAKPAKKGGAK